jgi:thiol:disulfide interchange protein DsbD
VKVEFIIIIAVAFLALVLVGFLVISTDNNQTSSEGLKWHTDLNSALNTAQSTNKMVLVDVYAPWCSWCKEMDKNTYQNPQVQQKLSNYVLLKVNGDENPDFMKKYQIYGYPTVLILDSSGNLVNTISGYQSPEDFINMI